MKRITSNTNTTTSLEIVALIFNPSVIKGYTTEGGYFYESDKSYYNNVLLSNAHLADAIKRVAAMLDTTEDYIRENLCIEDAAEHERRAAEYNRHLAWYAGVTC